MRPASGSARVPPQADGRTIRSIWPCWRRSPRRHRLGHPAARGRSPRPGADHGLRQLCGGGGRGLGHRSGSSRSIASSRPPIPAMSSTRSRSSAGRRLVRLWPVGLLYGECTVKGGRMEQENFDTYQVMRMARCPMVETIIMPSGGFWGGVGEPTIAVAAPAVLNAIFAATGKRIRTLPLKNHDLASDDEAREVQASADDRSRRWSLLAALAASCAGVGRRTTRRRSCSGCHAPAGASALRIPSLAGHAAAEIETADARLPSGERQATVMDRIARGFRSRRSRAIAAWLAQAEVSRDAPAVDVLPAAWRCWARLPLARAGCGRRRPGRVVVVGGGFAGATCARALNGADRELDVTLVEPADRLHRLPIQQRRALPGCAASRSSLRLRRAAAARHCRGARSGRRRRCRAPARSRAGGRQRHRLRPPGAGAGHRPALRRASGLRRGGGRDHAARLEGGRADRAAARQLEAMPDGGIGRHVRARQSLSAARPGPTSEPA